MLYQNLMGASLALPIVTRRYRSIRPPPSFSRVLNSYSAHETPTPTQRGLIKATLSSSESNSDATLVSALI